MALWMTSSIQTREWINWGWSVTLTKWWMKSARHHDSRKPCGNFCTFLDFIIWFFIYSYDGHHSIICCCYNASLDLLKQIFLDNNNRPILHWQKPKSKKPGFFVVPFTLPEKPITFGFFGTKSACAKKPESHTGFWVSGAHARLLSTFDRT